MLSLCDHQYIYIYATPPPLKFSYIWGGIPLKETHPKTPTAFCEPGARLWLKSAPNVKLSRLEGNATFRRLWSKSSPKVRLSVPPRDVASQLGVVFLFCFYMLTKEKPAFGGNPKKHTRGHLLVPSTRTGSSLQPHRSTNPNHKLDQNNVKQRFLSAVGGCGLFTKKNKCALVLTY